MSRSDNAAVFIDIALASSAAAAGLLDPTAGVVAVGAAVGLSDRVRYVLQRRAKRNFEAAAEGVLSSGRSVAESIDALLQSDEGIALVTESLDKIANAAFVEKARALGTCLGRAGGGPEESAEATIETEAAWARLINLLHKPHVAALVSLEGFEYEAVDESIVGAARSNRITKEFARTRAFIDSLKIYDKVTIQSVRADLVSWGLVKSVYGEEIGLHGGALDSDSFWRRTAHGDQVVRRLKADAGVLDTTES